MQSVLCLDVGVIFHCGLIEKSAFFLEICEEVVLGFDLLEGTTRHISMVFGIKTRMGVDLLHVLFGVLACNYGQDNGVCNGLCMLRFFLNSLFQHCFCLLRSAKEEF